MKGATVGLAIIAALALQTSPFFGRNGAGIDLVLVVVVWAALQFGPAAGLLTGAAAGLAQDVLSAGIIGVGGFSKTLIGYLVAVTSVRFSLENPLARLAIVAVASAANTVLFVGLHLMLEQPLADVSTYAGLGKTVGWRALGDTSTAVVLFLILDRVFAEQTAARRMAIKKRFYE